jgi:hypothetical protein
MSRSLKDGNKLLFDYLKSKSIDVFDNSQDKYIYISDINDKNFYTNSKKIASLKPIVGYEFALFEFSAEYYFCLIGADNPTFFFDGLSNIPISEGLFLSLYFDLKPQILKYTTSTDVKSFYEYYDSTYNGHDFNDLLKLFPPISVYKIALQSGDDYDNTLNKLAIDYFCSNPDSTILSFSAECIENYLVLCYSIGSIIPIDNILRSITASSWRYCFLDLYRCIENLYEIGRIHSHYLEFKSRFTFPTFYDKLTKTLKGKPNELDALDNLLSLHSIYLQTFLNNCKSSLDEKNSTFIYNLRNNIVHHRNDTVSLNLTESNWSDIIIFLTLSIDHSYNYFKGCY